GEAEGAFSIERQIVRRGHGQYPRDRWGNGQGEIFVSNGPRRNGGGALRVAAWLADATIHLLAAAANTTLGLSWRGGRGRRQQNRLQSDHRAEDCSRQPFHGVKV